MIPNQLALPASSLRRVLIALVTFALLAVSLSAPVLGAKGGNAANAKACQKGGWEDWVRQDQTPFASEEQCVSYAAMGGVLTVPAPAVFALAFTDVNSNHTYESGTDVLIAKLTDTNLDNVLSVGDTITTGQYPLTTAAATFGNFQTTSHAVTLVHANSASSVPVVAGSGRVFTWSSGQIESYSEHNIFISNGQTLLQDALVTFCDQMLVNSGSPSAPDTAVSLIADCAGTGINNDFVDVIIDLSGI